MENNLDPSNVREFIDSLFGTVLHQRAATLISKHPVSISFEKGDFSKTLIVSGIVKDNRSHEVKLVYKQQAAEPLKSNCDCNLWSSQNSCPHAAALFLTYLNYKKKGQALESNQLPTINLGSNLAVTPMEYGTIINSPQSLEGAPPNSTYSSLQYLLANNRVAQFPLPQNWQGKLVVNIASHKLVGSNEIEFEKLPLISFAHLTTDGRGSYKISIFENIYLFNWENGNAYHLTSELKSFIQKLRIYHNALSTNDLLQLTTGNDLRELVDVIIDNKKLEDLEKISPSCRINIVPSDDRKNFFDFEVNFIEDGGLNLLPPKSLSALTFSDGLLSSFKKKKDGYEFVKSLASSFANETDSYKKHLLTSSQKSQWLNIIHYLDKNLCTEIYDSHAKAVVRYDNLFLKEFITELYQSFGDVFFRFSINDIQYKKIIFQVSPPTLFSGLSHFYQKLSTYGLTIFYNKRELSSWKSKIKFERNLSSTQWFDLTFELSHEDLEIIKNSNLDQSFTLTKEGMVYLSPEDKNLLRFMKKYVEYEGVEQDSLPNADESINKFVVPFSRARIFELFELKKLGVEGALTSEEEKICHTLMTLKEIPAYPVPKDFKGELREYQVNGYNWLNFLYDNKLGACLADDMGLGKTVQAIAFLQKNYPQLEKVLIVCPVSILLNWEKEILRFSNMNISIYHGGSRSFSPDSKIILTSYGVMKKEADGIFSEHRFDVLILDEVQHLKNVRSLGAFAARKIQADFRICLTGTPVENDLAEFYNILDLCVPGIWGDLQFVRTVSSKKSRLLARKTSAPFILRRTKDQVLTELPPKQENNVYLSFSDEERMGYANNLIQIKTRIENSPSKRKYGEILKGLLQLRQNCLWQKNNVSTMGISSTKITFLLENLEQILEEGHQAIIFSQFTTYLDFIQTALNEKHWKYSRIDGSQSIKKRQEQVDLFQSGKKPIFLISLKAGGVGLNLTAASYVFVMDPWWNPAVESQAIDRAHRIGQKNTLTVYRPIIKDSVEEKVLLLQDRKRELFYDLLPSNDDRYFTGKLTMKDFEQLFSE